MTPPSLDRRTFVRTGAAVGTLAAAGCLAGLTQEDDLEGAALETVAEGFDSPWGITFLPDGDGILLTELEGRLTLLDRGGEDVRQVDGVPEVYAEGQGGLLDVALHPEFDEEPWVYLTYAAANDEGESTTYVGRGRLDPGAPELAEFEELFVAEPFLDGDGHYGSRAVFGEDGSLYVTTGDRQRKDFGPDHLSQDLTNELGKTLRLEPDGSVPEDNPFVGEEDAQDAIYSYGHRNAQGMTVHPETGAIWQSEHGEEDGDELNVIEAGGNYGWPIAAYGCEYGTDDPVGEDPDELEETIPPVYYWECNTGGFPPAGMTFYDGDAFPDWAGDLFVGNLAGEYLGRFSVEGTEPGEIDVEEEEPLLEERGWRVRDVEVDPETGDLYVLVDDADAPLVRLVPE
ncbi:PQQ-dependent sugar dehydrogenase [Natrononativus amylolyticus]|uniref:PQQ-dependent sugar dehydrogenase n=1 Tax=Natrononativus amylolyticus TaxID=2963434 RepID=UPI0020CF53AD|nr:PQQ-dependent sugar dehydrogenase [Natrononativus amylolyticus]